MYFKNKSIDQYFLEKECPYTKRRAIKVKTLYWGSGFLGFCFLIFVLFWGDKKEPTTFEKPSVLESQTVNQPQFSAADSNHSSWNPFGTSVQSSSSIRTQSISRNRNAGQVIRRSDSDPLGKVPIGTTIQAVLANKIALTSGTTPVVVEVTDDFGGISSVLNNGSKVLGNGSFDEANGRVSVRFHTVVSLEGEQKGIQATAMMPDGTSGISGNYHSAEPERQLGKVLTHFIGGLADGLKNRTAPTYSGNAYEPGSVRNGILNGITLSAEDQARGYSDQLSQTKASIEVMPGTPLLIYLEKEFP